MFTVPLSSIDCSDAETYSDSTGAYFTAEEGLRVDDYIDITGDDSFLLIDFIIYSIIGMNIQHEIDIRDLEQIHSFSNGYGYAIDGYDELISVIDSISIDFYVKLTIIEDSPVDLDYLDDVQRTALVQYLGTDVFSDGDSLEIRGSFSDLYTMERVDLFAEYDEDNCLGIGDRFDVHSHTESDVVLTYLPGGHYNDAKEFRYVFDHLNMGISETRLVFQKDIPDLKDGDLYTIDYSEETDYNGEYNLILGNVEYVSQSEREEYYVPTEEFPLYLDSTLLSKDLMGYDQVVTLDYLFEDGQYHGDALKEKLASIGAYGETFDALTEEISRLTTGNSGDVDEGDEGGSDDGDGLSTTLIIGAVAACAVVALAVFLVHNRSKP